MLLQVLPAQAKAMGTETGRQMASGRLGCRYLWSEMEGSELELHQILVPNLVTVASEHHHLQDHEMAREQVTQQQQDLKLQWGFQRLQYQSNTT